MAKTSDIYNRYIEEQQFISSVASHIGIYDVNIYTAQMEEDIDALAYILDNIYSGKDFLKKKGISISKRLNALKEKIQSIKSMNQVDFFECLCAALDDIKDSHLVFLFHISTRHIGFVRTIPSILLI